MKLCGQYREIYNIPEAMSLEELVAIFKTIQEDR